MPLVEIWALILACIIIIYVLLDGFDLGIGMLMPHYNEDKDRSILISTIVHVWDGNQTWLVLGGAVTYGAFPKAFAVLLPMLYTPIMLMIIALLLRGISLEFRLKAVSSKRYWDSLFCCSSWLVAFIQGVILGTFVQGFGHEPIDTHHLMPTPWLTGFSTLSGLGVAFGYRMLGAHWLIIKTSGAIQNQAYRHARTSLCAVAICLGIFSLWTPFINDDLHQRWLDLHHLPYLAILPLITTLLFILHYNFLRRQVIEKGLLLLSMLEFMCGYIGIVISIWPYIIPLSMTIYDASAPESALSFMLIGVSITAPLLLAYTLRAYAIFRGKVTEAIYK